MSDDSIRALALITRAARREWYWQQACASLLLLSGAALLRWACGQNTILSILGLGIALAGLRFAYLTCRHQQIEQTPMMCDLLRDPKQIVWVYGFITQQVPFGVQVFSTATLYFKRLDGHEHSLSVPPQALRPILSGLSAYLPHASFGYSSEKAQWYSADPRLLLRA